ncbi:3-oxoacyl-[acyl-carrier protein] reductase [hydrothermal vent metagenome]|uniref:3-oxoacyl-[acyl-carrier protein] reductase n=1 Tax=hydrothermal vent metagenome TaxID=652676 RepID=A0A3B1CEB1_9ZZZZ
MYDLKGKTAIVTGGTKGIGRAISVQMLKAGAVVVAVYASSDEAANRFADENSEHKERLEIVKLDVSDYKACEAFFRKFESEHEGLQILVNSAGIRRDAIAGMMKEEDWTKVIDVNLTGTFNMSKFAFKSMMRKKYGRIISITSPIGQMGMPGQANYAASKAGQVGFTRSLAKEIASRKITVNCVSPGFIDTGFIDDLPEKQKEAYMAMVPMRRFGTPEEVAHCVMFLASDEAGYVTGATLEVTGGL